MKFSKIYLVLLSCISLTKGAVIPVENGNADLSSFFSNLLGQQSPATNNDNVKEVTQIAGVTANPTEINDDYTQDDVNKYAKYLIDLITGDNDVTTTTAALTTTSVATATSDIFSELDNIKEKKVGEIDELINIIKNVSERLGALETAVQQSNNKQEVDNSAQTLINENDNKFAAILNKENEKETDTIEKTKVELLDEIKGLLNDDKAELKLNLGRAMLAIKDVQAKKTDENKNTQSAPPETIIEQKSSKNEEFENLYKEISRIIDDYAAMVSNKENVSSNEQFTKAAMIRDKTKTIKQYINKLVSLAESEEQKKKSEDINKKYDEVESGHIEKVNNNEEIVKEEDAAKTAAKEEIAEIAEIAKEVAEEIAKEEDENTEDEKLAGIKLNLGKAMLALKDVQAKKSEENGNAQTAPPPETSKETIIEQKNNVGEEFENLYKEISGIIDDYAAMISNKENVSDNEQFTKAAMIRDKTKTIKQYINKLVSLAESEEQKKKSEDINKKYDEVESGHIEKVNNNEEIIKEEDAAKEEVKSSSISNEGFVDEIKKLLGNGKALIFAGNKGNENSNEKSKAVPPPETSNESIIEQKNKEIDEFEKLHQEISEIIDDYKKAVSNEENAVSDDQFTKAAIIRDKTRDIKQYINKLASLVETVNQQEKLDDINKKYDDVESSNIENVINNQDIAMEEEAAKEIAKEIAKDIKAIEKEKENKKHVISIDRAKKLIGEIAASTTNEAEVDEVQRIIEEIQLSNQAKNVKEENTNVDVNESLKKALNEVASNTLNNEQVDEVRQFIKSIEAKAIVDDNLNKDEVIKKLIYDISANSTTEEQVHQIQRILEKIELYNKFAEEKQQEREDNLAFGHKFAEEIQKSPEEISNDLKTLLVNLVNQATTEEEAANVINIITQIKNREAEEKQQEREDNLAFGYKLAEEIQKTPDEISNDLKTLLVNLVNQATTEEEASNVANIITQIKKHDELIKEQQNAKDEELVKIPNTEAYLIDFDDGTSNKIYLKEDVDEQVETEKVEDPVINLEVIDDNESQGKGIYILGAFGIIALAGFGYTYRSKAKKYNDDFPFSDNNLPFSDSMNGLVVDKHFLLRKNSIEKPDNIINNDAVIRPSQPSWATSMLMDENNKKGLKEGIQMTEDPEQLLDEQLREIENKEKVIVNKVANSPSVVITIDENNVKTEVKEEAQKPKQKKTAKKPKLRRSISVISLDKKIKEEKGENAEKKHSKKEKKDKKQKKARKTKSLIIEKKVEEELIGLDEELELSLNTSFILDAPSLLFNDEEIVDNKKNNNLLNTEKPKVPKRISSCTPETKEVLPTVPESEEMLPILAELDNEDIECQFSQEFAKELMEDYNKKFGEMEDKN